MKKLTFVVNNEFSHNNAKRALDEIDYSKPVSVTIEKYVKKRSGGQNSLQWAALLGDFSMQAIIDGKQFSSKVWHEHLKEKFLPETYEEGITMKSYVKWLELPFGELKLIGSTTKLTTLGFSDYMERCYAYGAGELDIKFSANPKDYD